MWGVVGAGRPFPLEANRCRLNSRTSKMGHEIVTSGDWALLISGFSMAVALGSLSWNILQKFIFVKPTVQASFGNNVIIRPGQTPEQAKDIWSLSATNMGPGDVIIHMCVLKERTTGWFKRDVHGIINPIDGDIEADEPLSAGPFSGGLPAKFPQGESRSFYFPFTRKTFLLEQTTNIGFVDTYNRYIWCRKKDVKRAKEAYKEKFGALPTDHPEDDNITDR